MKRYLTALMMLVAFSMGMQAQENQSYILHTIEKGQTLYSISSMYHVSIDEITALNPGSENTIVEGRKLKIPRKQQNTSEGTFHTIASGETLYRLSVNYKVSVKSIMDANPGLTANNFKAGQVIRIPATSEASDAPVQEAAAAAPTPKQIPDAVQSNCREMHRVEKGETVYSIARKFGVTEEDIYTANPELKRDAKKLKKGKFICIPYPPKKEEPKQEIPTDKELFKQKEQTPAKRINTIKAAVILPFLNSKGEKTSETERMVEYYQGFLLAIDSLKRTGTSVELFTYNSGEDVAQLNELLAKSEMKNMDIIFGPLYTSQIQPLGDFAQANGIRLVVPFTSRDNTVYNNAAVYQINTPQSYFYSEVYEHFTRQFPRANVIFLQSQGNDKDEFIKGLKEELQRKSIPMTTLSESAADEDMKGAMRNDRDNFFIPTSGDKATLIKTLPQLTMVARDSLLTTKVHLFGYPEWQTYTNDYLSTFFELDTYFYTSFYTNNLLKEPQNFIKKFQRWYGKDPEERYPSYSMLGFDTGFYFLKGLALYGSAFDDNLKNMRFTPIQTDFKLERVNNWGGFINKKVFFVHLSNEFQLSKLDFD